MSLNKINSKQTNKTFQIRRIVKNSIEQEKALRDQLLIEIENKTKACSNPTYVCSIPRLDGYEFCIRHILQDPRAPFKQCAYTYSNGKKCNQAAPKHDSKKDVAITNFCFEHSRLVQLTKTHEIVGQYKQVESNEAYLNDLTHHIKIDKRNSPSPKPDNDEEIDVVSSNVEPFTTFDSKNSDDKEKRRMLDYASDSTSDDDDGLNVNGCWKEHEWENSDNESVDSQNEDYLKHAGIYTTEEATMITKQKMLRLQALYTGQIQRLQHLLKERRRKYLQSIRKERETLCSIHDQIKDTPQERKLYEKLKALNHYHKRYGVEAVLQKKFHERRLKANEISVMHKGPLYTKCIFTEGGVKCGERALPCCKYCKKHILEDKKQILFRSCGVEKSGIVCQEPVPNIFEDATCVLHIKFPAQRTYTQKKFESETEEDDDDNNFLTKKTMKNELKYEDEMDNTNINNTTKVDNTNKLNKIFNKTEINVKNMDIKEEKEDTIENLTADQEDNIIVKENNTNNGVADGDNDDVEMIEIKDTGKNITIAHDSSVGKPLKNSLKDEVLKNDDDNEKDSIEITKASNQTTKETKTNCDDKEEVITGLKAKQSHNNNNSKIL